MLGYPPNPIDHVFHFGLGQQQVFLTHLLYPFRSEAAIPERQPGRADLANQRLILSTAFRCATEQLENGFALLCLLIVKAGNVTEAQWFTFRDGNHTSTPLQQAAHFALNAGTGNIRLLGNRILDNGIISTTDMHFHIAAADVQATQQFDITGDFGNTSQFHVGFPVYLSDGRSSL